VENLYDRRDDPFDGCDFTGNPGCPGVNPPFDYVPASEAVYQAHLEDIAHQIISDLHGPDIIFVQEAEDQDICTVSNGSLSCGTTDNADGKPDTLQELATKIALLGGRPTMRSMIAMAQTIAASSQPSSIGRIVSSFCLHRPPIQCSGVPQL
jgi:hypothetical protein